MVSLGPLAAAAQRIAQSGGVSGPAPQAPVERARFYAPAAPGGTAATAAKPPAAGSTLPAPSATPPSPNTPRGSLLDISV
ncbi:MAG: hypothetical protein JSR21_03755 [Proteobacteria bacterium]|nr:hypothetical protein [Pseudomonadota bacterium]